MAKRTTIVIPFNYDEGWTGGNYYIANLVSSFTFLPEQRQPDVLILSHSKVSYEFVSKASSYKRVKWVSSLMVGGIDGGLFRRLRLLAKLVPSFFKSPLKFDAIFPFPIDTKERRKTICWIPDFQEKALPHLFSAEELSFRTNQHQYYIENFDNILFSSHAALADFDRFYPDAKNKKHVMQFAVAEVPVIPGIASVLKRLGLPDVFFYCPNQFWLHKNHKAVIEAVRILRNNGASVTVAFSGKELDRRDPDHVDKLKHRVVELGLEKEIKFLGFISKEDQYALLDSAVAMIQPSLFEGWSTVVEEAKSKSCYVLASDIPVHREQLNSNASFFDPEDPAELAAAMEVRLSKPSDHNAIDYNSNRRNFAITFMEIVDSLKRSS